MLKIKFYGVRGVYPHGGEQMNSAVVTTESGPFLVDLGSPLIFEDMELMARLDHTLITHHHPDHIAFLASLIISRLAIVQDSDGEAQPCNFVSPHPVKEHMEYVGINGIESYTEHIDIPSRWKGVGLSGMVTAHPAVNYAYKISTDKTTLVFTGDTTYSPELADFCKGVDMLVVESSFPDDKIDNALRWGHMCPQLTARLLDEAAPAKTVLNHFVEMEPDDYRRAVIEIAEGEHEIICSHDGMEIEVEP